MTNRDRDLLDEAEQFLADSPNAQARDLAARIKQRLDKVAHAKRMLVLGQDEVATIDAARTFATRRVAQITNLDLGRGCDVRQWHDTSGVKVKPSGYPAPVETQTTNPQADMTTRAKCQALAKRLGCEIEIDRPRSGKLVQIHLPAGQQMEGNPGLNALSHNVEADEDIWPGVYADLQALDGGMEPLDERYSQMLLSLSEEIARAIDPEAWAGMILRDGEDISDSRRWLARKAAERVLKIVQSKTDH